jgi:hypothetical protein
VSTDTDLLAHITSVSVIAILIIFGNSLGKGSISENYFLSENVSQSENIADSVCGCLVINSCM